MPGEFFADTETCELLALDGASPKTYGNKLEPLMSVEGDIADMLKIDLASGTTADIKKVISLANSVEKTFLQKYGSFISKNKPAIEDKLVITDEDGMRDLVQIFSNEEDRLARGAFSRTGGFIVFDNTANSWERIDDDYKTDAEIAVAFGQWPENEKAQRLKHDFDTHDLAHEITHYYQNQTNSVTIRECGAYYYQRQIAIEMLSYPRMGKHLLHAYRGRYYERLVDEFGDDMHRFFFGRLKKNVKGEILSRFESPEVIKLFPERQKKAS